MKTHAFRLQTSWQLPRVRLPFDLYHDPIHLYAQMSSLAPSVCAANLATEGFKINARVKISDWSARFVVELPSHYELVDVLLLVRKGKLVNAFTNVCVGIQASWYFHVSLQKKLSKVNAN